MSSRPFPLLQQPPKTLAVEVNGTLRPGVTAKDVFLHITVLRNAGLSSLVPGQPVHMQVVTARKGPEAVSVELAGPAPAGPVGPGDDMR